MTIRELIKRLESFDLDMPVAFRSKDGGEYFVELTASDILELKTEEIANCGTFFTGRVFDASERIRKNTTKVLSLTGGTIFQRGKNGKNSKDL